MLAWRLLPCEGQVVTGPVVMDCVDFGALDDQKSTQSPGLSGAGHAEGPVAWGWLAGSSGPRRGAGCYGGVFGAGPGIGVG
ncbi:Hypothetical protein AJAP_31170 [Amycolatopsis japonica]|uniref:Uncharacterized protein n=1 Tax=Amycolatopsis japonica TaxID=208439 RepID=A0A075V397_9PSEU|nr:Hypothetical protein AJAP_31170 [Amycolatopsis japonica]